MADKPRVVPIACETAANKLKRKMPYGWDLNAYRGCGHGCAYCYARYTHDYLGGEDFAGDIYAKTNIAERLEKQLAAKSWQRDVVNLGGVTDSYQPAEAEYKLMPDILRLLIRTRTPAIISTKSDLILRDFDLIAELARVSYVNIAASIITPDDAIRGKLEPGASPIPKRFEVLRAFAKTEATRGLHCMPIVPYITDGAQEFDELFREAKACEVTYVLPGALYLRGPSRAAFFAAVEQHFPEKQEPLRALYKTGGAGKEYKQEMYKTLNFYRDKYALSKSYAAPMKQKLEAARRRWEQEQPMQASFWEEQG